jgi:phenylpropionate dioxygenase-like ring-hydroxylating dioxygenase large terminal subunit
MLINNWYVAAESTELQPGKPVGKRMLGFDFVLFRTADGTISCLHDVCAHRGASLQRGKMCGEKHDRVACPFHGWEFNAEGKCTTIPSMGPDFPIPQRARVDAYPVEEKYGLVWVFLGDLPADRRPEVPELLPEYEAETGWRCMHWSNTVPTGWTKAKENSLDTAHLSFVHSTFGNRQSPRAVFAPIQRTRYGARVERVRDAPRAAQKSGVMAELLSEERAKTKVTLEFAMSGICHRIAPEFRPGMLQVTYAAYTPIDRLNTQVYAITARNFALEEKYDEERMKGNMLAAQEDGAVVRHVRPRLGPTPLKDEVLVRADEMETIFRRLVVQMIEKGWEIDSAKVEAEWDTKVYAIPCPARREPGTQWVHDPVPTTRPRDYENEAFDFRGAAIPEAAE